MAENNKLTPTLSARDHFIGIALRALIEQQITSKHVGEYAVAADHAVRYADAVMASRAREPRQTVSTGGRGVPVQPTPIPFTAKMPEDLSDLSKNLGEAIEETVPRSSGNIEGELPPNIVPPIAQREAFKEPLTEVK
jgi:hypothetical protein